MNFKADSYSRDAQVFQDDGDHATAAMYRCIARDLRECAKTIAAEVGRVRQALLATETPGSPALLNGAPTSSHSCPSCGHEHIAPIPIGPESPGPAGARPPTGPVDL